MAGGLGRAVLLGLIAGLACWASSAWAKRAAPADVAPVLHEGRRYEIPHFNNPCGRNGGCIVAYEQATGAQLWALRVYCTHYDLERETDVQDVFISSLSVDSGRLVVTNERGLKFAIDPGTRAVSGDPRGCGCSYSPQSEPTSLPVASALLAPLLGMVLIWRRQRGRTRAAAEGHDGSVIPEDLGSEVSAPSTN